MHLLKFAILLLSIATALAVSILTGCSSPSAPTPATVEAARAGGDWGFLKFAEVRAFRMNWDDEMSMDYFVGEKGRLNATRMPKDGVRLNGEQVERLRAAVTGKHPTHPVAMCLYPHHAFAFYDAKGKMVGHINVCFLCANYMGDPEGFARTWDLAAIAQVVKDLGMPLSNPAWR